MRNYLCRAIGGMYPSLTSYTRKEVRDNDVNKKSDYLRNNRKSTISPR